MLPRSDMEGMAQGVVDTLSPMFNPSSDLTVSPPRFGFAYRPYRGPTSLSNGRNIPHGLSLRKYDLQRVGSQQYEHLLLSESRNLKDHNSQVVIWGLAAVSAYRAYNDSTTLAHATTIWDQVSPYQIQPRDAANGFAASVNASIPATCNGSTVVGGVFAYPPGSQFPGAAQRPTDVDGETVGAFVALSAHLYELTSEQKYLAAAISGAEFLQNHMQAGNVSLDTFSVGPCQVLSLQPYTYITGFTIWGLSVLATHNASWTPFLNSLISTSVPYTGWTSGLNGIVTEGSSDGSQSFSQPNDVLTDGTCSCLKAVWIRGLHEAWTRMDPAFDSAKFIEAYLYVQFNALRDLALNPANNSYSPDWQGPAIEPVLSWGQLNALDVMNAAFAMAPAPTSSSVGVSTSTSYTTSTAITAVSTGAAQPATSKRSQSHLAIIIGVLVSVAGLGLIAVLFVIIPCLRRHRKKQAFPDRDLDLIGRVTRSEQVEQAVEAAYGINPFMDQTGAGPIAARGSNFESETRDLKNDILGYTVQVETGGSEHTALSPSTSAWDVAGDTASDAGGAPTNMINHPPLSPPISHNRSFVLDPHTDVLDGEMARRTEVLQLPQLITGLMNLLSTFQHEQAQAQHGSPPPRYDEADDR
ncbi:hypothetical protein NM688_g4606 [Phlebia brevispora]|uniref:Uncharacterized protein n=1 Tax=Phlebia brevispora TaxID=194682 RepID=A0ACC1T2G3_9APHY|nr:hypothetical protein NM688_g4606 [Phlebia brevispora]